MRRVSMIVAVGFSAAMLAVAGCKTTRQAVDSARGCEPTAPTPTVSRVLPGDTLHGRLACGTGCQCFYFEGLEYAFLDYKLSTEAACQAMPTLSIEDPEGKPIDVGNGRSAKGIVMRKSGTYKGLVCGAGGGEVVYAFEHDIRTSEPPERIVALTPESKEKLSFVAPRGANCVVTIQPLHACNCVPKVLAVYGPNGSRALDAEKQLEGAAAPSVVDGRGNMETLHFNAAQPGRYTVVLASECGTEGDARLVAQVFPPKSCKRDLFHDNHPCPPTPGACAPPSQVASTR